MAIVRLMAVCIMDSGDVSYEEVLEAIGKNPEEAIVAMMAHPELQLEVALGVPKEEPTSLIIH